MLTLSHIRKDYGKFTAVEDINLELENGLYAMLAPNGAGKTTLIILINVVFPAPFGASMAYKPFSSSRLISSTAVNFP